MGQQEIIQALKNLGGIAILSDLEKEYFKLLYPPQIYGEDYVKNKKYDCRTIFSKYLLKLRLNNIIKRDQVMKSSDEYLQEYNRRIKENGTANGITTKNILIKLLI
jgi:hypothetical protein